MRNLKKILALVLAMIMSLSLMATAGATEFPDDDKISDTYRTAAEVLNKLNVFAGDQNGNFNPTAPITRAEVAAIIYRITTGDTGVEQHKTYAPYNQFPDVQAEDWFAGYVTYCANAGYIKGRNTGKFDAKDSVTGYEVLAMILRAVGYDKNNEFVGGNWQNNTASIATQRGVLKNVLEDPAVRLSEPATRQVVAELLFQASLIPQVTWNAATLSYREDGETLGMENFGLEGIEGVVTANQWANINDDSASVLADNTTQLRLADNTSYTVDQATDLDAVGQTYVAYVSGKGSNSKQALTMDLSDKNVVAFNEGKSVNVGSLDASETHANASYDQGFASIAGLAGTENIGLGADTLYYLNYDLHYSDWETTDIIIRYAVAKIAVDGYTNPAPAGSKIYGTNGLEIGTIRANTDWQYYRSEVAAGNVAGHSVETRTIRVNWDVNLSGGIDQNDTLDCYVFTISPEYRVGNSWADTRINATDLAIMQDIFYNADRLGTNSSDNNNYNTQNYVYGEVYVGTTSMTDESDTLNWKQFQEKYFIDHETQAYAGCGNGNSLRVIDNDGDGVAEYVFKVTYTQDRAVTSYNGSLEFHLLSPASNTVWDAEGGKDAFEVGDVVNYRTIDGKTTVWKAEKVTDTIKDKLFRNITVVPTNHDALGQSDIANATEMSDDIMNMLDLTEYNMYLDEFGFIRTYELAQGSQYALVTEVYPINDRNHNYVTDRDWIAEIKAGDADIDEFVISNAIANPFITNYAWTSRVSRYSTANDLNYLQPAVAHLNMIPGNTALTRQFFGATAGNTPAYQDLGWNRGVFEMTDAASVRGATSIRASAVGDYGVFDYGTIAVEDENYHTSSYTNVASYTMGEGTVALSSASQLAFDKNGQQLYRVGSTAVQGSTGFGVDSTKQLVQGAYGTEAQLKEMWVHDNTRSTDGALAVGTPYATGANPTAAQIQTAANNWWNNNYSGSTTTVVAKNGTMIYPMYEVDYVQLATNQNVSSSLRHYNIDTNYGTYYNTNSNNYVNAVSDTEFYVVMPNRVNHYASYAELPAIAAEDIRAMYAVATNTQANAAGLDFWTADVIVIETNGLVTSYDSVSLMYYNPWENTSSVRYVDSLNNQWRAHGAADPDITVVPTTVTGASDSWGNQSWNRGQYGFYALFGTEYSAEADQLGAANATIINRDFNDYGIYAGTIRRLSSRIAGSNYMDVDLLGRTTLLQDDNAVWTVGIRVNGEEVPIYRVYDRSVGTLRLAPTSVNNEVFVDDEIIWVTDRSGNVAYIIDLGPRQGYTCPTYLFNAGTGIYERIIAEQTARLTVPSTDWVAVDLEANLGANQKMTITGDSSELKNPVVFETNAVGGAVEHDLELNAGLAGVRLKVSLIDKTTGNPDPVALAGVIGRVTSSGSGVWTVTGFALNSDGVTYTLQLANSYVAPGRSASVNNSLVLYTQERIDELVAAASKTVGDGITAEEMQSVIDELSAIAGWTDNGASSELKVPTIEVGITPGAGMDTEDDVNDLNSAIDTAITQTENKVVSVTGAGDFTVSPSALTKGSSLAGVVLTLTPNEGKALPETITSIAMSETVDSGKYTYNAAKGTITFGAEAGTATADITVTATAGNVAPAPSATVSLTKGAASNLTATTTAKAGEALAGKTITLAVASAAATSGYTLPAANGIVSITVDGNVISSANYEYNNGKITFVNNAQMEATTAKTIVVEAEAVAPAAVEVAVNEADLTANPTSFAYGTALANQTITLAVAEGVDKVLPHAVTKIEMGGVEIANTNYTYADGVITFGNSYDGKATGKIVITTDLDTETLGNMINAVPGRMTGGTEQKPQGDNATSYSVEMNRKTSTITVNVAGLKVHKNGNNQDGYWLGVGVTAIDGATYKWGRTAPNPSEQELASPTNSMEVNGVGYDTFYWGASTKWTEWPIQEGYIEVTANGQTVRYKVLYNVTLDTSSVTPEGTAVVEEFSLSPEMI